MTAPLFFSWPKRIPGRHGSDDKRLCRVDVEKARVDILVSIPAIGAATPLTMLIRMPELGLIENKCVAFLAGLALVARDSGQHSGKRLIRAGRADLRQTFYMPALVAIRFNAENDDQAKGPALLETFTNRYHRHSRHHAKARDPC